MNFLIVLTRTSKQIPGTPLPKETLLVIILAYPGSGNEEPVKRITTICRKTSSFWLWFETLKRTNSWWNEIRKGTNKKATKTVQSSVFKEDIIKGQHSDADLKVIRRWLEKDSKPDWKEISRHGPTVKGYWM